MFPTAEPTSPLPVMSAQICSGLISTLPNIMSAANARISTMLRVNDIIRFLLIMLNVKLKVES
jgi:hypothetical protein